MIYGLVKEHSRAMEGDEIPPDVKSNPLIDPRSVSQILKAFG